MAKYIHETEGVYVSQTWVSRLWRECKLQPWRQGTFKVSKDPKFEEKVRDVVGLYLNPPEGEAVLSVDAKTGIQALDRTQPVLPMTFDKTEKRTHDYVRWPKLNKIGLRRGGGMCRDQVERRQVHAQRI